MNVKQCAIGQDGGVDLREVFTVETNRHWFRGPHAAGRQGLLDAWMLPSYITCLNLFSTG